MTAILGIDAAWTQNHPSGVALIRRSADTVWECVAVEDSYQAFLNRSGISFNQKVAGSVPVTELLNAAVMMAGTEVKLVVVDAPLAKVPIMGRRHADNEISRLFGEKGCSTHTPSPIRPGPVSEQIRDGFRSNGYVLTTTCSACLPDRALIETYPHPALLLLMNASYRIPYKVSKARKYHPHLSPAGRRTEIYEKLQGIQTELSKSICKIDIAFPAEVPNTKGLKSIEDRIDALVCAWVGIQALKGAAVGIGNDEAAIWLPSGLLRPTNWSALLAPEAKASEEFMQGVDELPLEHRALKFS